jgi:hypothetical protein
MLDNQSKTLSDAPSSCHMSQVVEKLSTSSLWPTGPTSFEGKGWKFAGGFHDDHGGRVFAGDAVTVHEVVFTRSSCGHDQSSSELVAFL